jgi:hypothetical protein
MVDFDLTDKLQKFKKAIEKTPYRLRECSICSTPLFFFFDGQSIVFNSTCGCVRYESPDVIQFDEDLVFYLDPGHGHLESIEKFIEENL